jgi:hypothetical protein
MLVYFIVWPAFGDARPNQAAGFHLVEELDCPILRSSKFARSCFFEIGHTL